MSENEPEYDGRADLVGTVGEIDDWANAPYGVATDVAIGSLDADELRWYLRCAVIALSMHGRTEF